MILKAICYGKVIDVRTAVARYEASKYQRAVLLTDNSTSEPMGKLTCFIDDATVGPLESDEIVVKTWSENEWVFQLLDMYPGIFKDTGRRVATGMAIASIWTFKDTNNE